MLLSSGVVWRHRTLDEFRAECPGGDPALQRARRRRARRRARLAGVARRAGRWRGRPAIRARSAGASTRAGLTDALVRAAGDVRLGEAFARRRGSSRRAASPAASRASAGCSLRANPWSEGDGLAYALARGADLSARHGRVLRPQPAGGGARGAASSCGRAAVRPPRARPRRRRARVLSRRAVLVRERPRPGDRAPTRPCRVVRRRRSAHCGERVRERTVADLVEAARAAGGDVRPAGRAAVRAAAVAEARRAAVPRGPRPRVGHAHDRRAPDRRARARPARRTARRSAGSTRPARTPAASSPAATAAAWRRRSSSAASRPRPRWQTAT